MGALEVARVTVVTVAAAAGQVVGAMEDIRHREVVLAALLHGPAEQGVAPADREVIPVIGPLKPLN